METRKSPTVPKRHWSIPWTRWNQSTFSYCILYSFSLTFYLLTWKIWWAPNNASKGQMGFNSAFKGLIISSHLRPETSSCLLLSGFPTKTLDECCFPLIWTTCTANFILLDSVMQSVCVERYKSLRPALYILSCIKLYFIPIENLPNKRRQSVA